MKIQEIDALSISSLMEILDVAKGIVKANLEGRQCSHGLWEKLRENEPDCSLGASASGGQQG